MALQSTLASEYTGSMDVLGILLENVESNTREFTFLGSLNQGIADDIIPLLATIQELKLFSSIGVLGRMEGDDRDKGLERLSSVLVVMMAGHRTSKWIVKVGLGILPTGDKR
jgi:hypothetical protein